MIQNVHLQLYKLIIFSSLYSMMIDIKDAHVWAYLVL